ncbi:MAG: PQQ-like beta-propeller repeat protein, partial [Deltaproteobacteria bacterium]|nr:PQQ-like beta-propeller repeat protein [Candidatus Zymogenaceae bacterium]
MIRKKTSPIIPFVAFFAAVALIGGAMVPASCGKKAGETTAPPPAGKGYPYGGSKVETPTAPMDVQFLTDAQVERIRTERPGPYLPMSRGNPAHTGAFDEAGPKASPQVLWKFKAPVTVFGSPAVADGAVYAGSGDKNVYALDAVTGKEKWRFRTGSYVESSPAVANGVVYVGSDDRNVYALDAATGAEKWRFATGGRVVSSPTVEGGVVYVGGYDGNVYALDAATGKEKWRANDMDGESSPAFAYGVVYKSTNIGRLHAIDADTGDIKWTYSQDYPSFTAPAVANGIAYVGTSNYYVFA